MNDADSEVGAGVEADGARENSATPELGDHYGCDTADLVAQVFEEGADRVVVLMRHSARTFDRSIHDLLNPLTEHGRSLCRNFGERLPKTVACRGYASPPERCVETSEIIIATHRDHGGRGHRTRPVEALGVFYALDQQKMWKGLSAADGLADYVNRWFDGQVPDDAMMPAELAVRLILNVLNSRLKAAPLARGMPQLDLCVSHDMTVYTMRHGVGLETVDGPRVEFLDGLVLFQQGETTLMRSQHGGEVDLTAMLEEGV